MRRPLIAVMILGSLAAVMALRLAWQSGLEWVLGDIQASHIDGNVPPPAAFGPFLQRDLKAYFTQRGIKTPIIRYLLLRDGPTQSGIAYPKYYLWVWVWSGTTAAASGAACVEAVDRRRFEVTEFLERRAILSGPDSVRSVFPAAVAAAIRAQAASPAFPTLPH
jgi:hypothetical protein